jgi:hypothetical protein
MLGYTWKGGGDLFKAPRQGAWISAAVSIPAVTINFFMKKGV